MTPVYTGQLHTQGRIAAVLIDIDGVLCNVDWDCTPETFTWQEFQKRDVDRITLWEGVILAKMFIQAGLHPVFLTARNENMREQTEKFLADIGMHGCLVMTSSGEGSEVEGYDYQEVQAESKEKALESLVNEFCFIYAIDDQQANCEVYRSFGIPVLKAMFTEEAP
jgi:hypothetical protein